MTNLDLELKALLPAYRLEGKSPTTIKGYLPFLARS